MNQEKLSRVIKEHISSHADFDIWKILSKIPFLFLKSKTVIDWESLSGVLIKMIRNHTHAK